MPTHLILPILSLLCLVTACDQKESSPPQAPEGPSETASSAPAAPAQSNPEKPSAPAAQWFGAPFTKQPAVPEVALSEVLKQPDDYAEKTIVTSGTVERACSNKGCWMEIVDGESKCRVTFKDYGFFVPTDAAGAHSRLQGTIATKTLSAGRVKHLEQEGARFANKAADGTAQEVRLIATAVQLTR